MDELTTNTPLTPPVSGVSPVQHLPTEIVSEMPEALKNAGGLSQYPITSMIETLRRDTGGIRGDGPLLMLSSLIQNLEHRSLVERSEYQQIRGKLDAVNTENGRLSVENAVLKNEVEHKDSDKDARTAFVGIGALGFGIAAPLAITSPTAVPILCTVLFAGVFVCGLFYPKKKKVSS